MMPSDAFPLTSSIAGLPCELKNPNPQLQQQQQQRQQPAPAKEKRRLPGTPDPDSEVIALSPRTLMATNRFVCEVCSKGFQREQNLQLHKRGHNLPWKLKKRTGKEVVRKRVYVCPERTCVHHDPSRALGDLTGVKKHFSRKHGEKKWKCERCSKKYAVKSDWKAHAKVCGTREYRCDCGTVFSRKDSFITHRAFCDALTEGSARFSCPIATAAAAAAVSGVGLGFKSDAHHHNADGDPSLGFGHGLLPASIPQFYPISGPSYDSEAAASMGLPQLLPMGPGEYSSGSSRVAEYGGCSALQQTGADLSLSNSSAYGLREEGETGQQLVERYTRNENTTHLSATALLQKAAQMGVSASSNSSFSSSPSSSSSSSLFLSGFGGLMSSTRSFNYGIENKNEFQLFINQGRQLDTFPLPGEMLRGEENPAATVSAGAAGVMMIMASSGHDQPSVISSGTNPWGHGLTRDFLGLGGDDTTRPFLQQELAKFASMVPGMDLMSSSYGGAH